MMEKMKKSKELFKEIKKNYLEISNILNEIYNIKKSNLNDKCGIENRIRFFIENIENLKILRDSIIESEKLIKEKKEEIKEGEKKKENNEEKKKENNKANIEKKKNEKNNIIILNIEEINKLKNSFNNINKFANEIIDTKKIPFLAFKNLIDGFINPNKLKENKFDPNRKKETIDEKQRAQIHYNKINELNNNYTSRKNQIFGELSNINLEFLEEAQKNKLIEISINIFIYLTENQKNKIKEKFFPLIGDDEIAEILYFDIENIFKETDKKNIKQKIIYKNIVERLSFYLTNNSKRLYEQDEKRQKKINRENISDILLAIYKELLIYQNKEKTYVNLNKDNIIEKIYYYLIINFFTYSDIFENGEKLYKFLFVKYLYEQKQNHTFIELIQIKEQIKKQIIIYSEEDLKNTEKNEEKLKSDENDLDNDDEDDSIANNILKNNIKKIIPEQYIKLYSEIQQNISNFYTIPFPINILVNYDNINFTFNIINMILYYRNYINQKNWIINYKKSLINLEKDIFEHYKRSTYEYVDKEGDNKLIGYKINKKMKDTYNNLIKFLTDNLPYSRKYKIQFIPFGSVTQFLNGKNGDIDLFLYIESKKQDPEDLKHYHQKILNKLKEILYKNIKKVVIHQTNRLCLFTFEYEEIKIDINVYGICSYYGEILLREYSLMDFRFPMLVVYLKYIISKYNIKNSETDKLFINSFAWTNILLTFLQDILKPPLFPKLLNEKNKKKIKIKVGGGPGKNIKKELEDEIKYQRIKNFDVLDLDKNNYNNIDNIKNKFYKREEKNTNKNDNLDYTNKMSLSEILLKFIQFIGYFFNYRYIMVNTNYEYQGFMPKIEKIKSKDEFVKLVYKKCDDPDNALLIREPFDHTYNPCKSVSPDKLDEIQEKFRKIYINILEKGEI